MLSDLQHLQLQHLQSALQHLQLQHCRIWTSSLWSSHEGLTFDELQVHYGVSFSSADKAGTGLAESFESLQ